MKFENIRVMNFENAIRGMRNPKNSWDLSDSKFGLNGMMGSMIRVDIEAMQVAQKWAEFLCEQENQPANILNDYYLRHQKKKLEWIEKNGTIYTYIGIG